MLTHKQHLFVEAFIATGGNATRAAEEAGYSGGAAAWATRGSENLRKQEVAKAIEARMPHLLERARASSRKPRRCQVYVIKADGLDRYKIGISRQALRARLKALQVGSPVRLRLVLSFPGGVTEEAMLHDRFFQRHSHGEWFDLTAEDVDWIMGYADEQADRKAA